MARACGAAGRGDGETGRRPAAPGARSRTPALAVRRRGHVEPTQLSARRRTRCTVYFVLCTVHSVLRTAHFGRRSRNSTREERWTERHAAAQRGGATGLLAVLAGWALSDSGRLLLNRGRRPDTAENGAVEQKSSGAEERWNGRAVRREKWAAVRTALDVGERTVCRLGPATVLDRTTATLCAPCKTCAKPVQNLCKISAGPV